MHVVTGLHWSIRIRWFFSVRERWTENNEGQGEGIGGDTGAVEEDRGRKREMASRKFCHALRRPTRVASSFVFAACSITPIICALRNKTVFRFSRISDRSSRDIFQRRFATRGNIRGDPRWWGKPSVHTWKLNGLILLWSSSHGKCTQWERERVIISLVLKFNSQCGPLSIDLFNELINDTKFDTDNGLTKYLSGWCIFAYAKCYQFVIFQIVFLSFISKCVYINVLVVLWGYFYAYVWWLYQRGFKHLAFVCERDIYEYYN